jgi:hypothetical protein
MSPDAKAVLLLAAAVAILVVGFWLWAEIDAYFARRRYRLRRRESRLRADVFDEDVRARATERLRRGGW